MTVLSKLPLSKPLAKISQKKYDFFVLLPIRQVKTFIILVFTNIVIPIPGILTGVKLMKIHQIKERKPLVNHGKKCLDNNSNIFFQKKKIKSS